MGNPDTGVDTDQWFVGLQWDEMGPGVLGAAIGSNGPMDETADEVKMAEAFYSYPLNDSMTITPVIYVEGGTGAENDTGYIVKTSFSF